MNATSSLSRRDFLSQLAVAGIAWPLVGPGRSLGAASPRKHYPIIAFSKAFQHLNFEETADFVAEVGWDGIECPVRKGGHVLPERVEDDLPKMVEALKKRQRAVTMITTDIRNATDPLTLRVLRTASQLGIRFYRLTSLRYQRNKLLPEQWPAIRADLRELVALNKELGLCAGFQNHSGGDYIGAPIWDIYELIKDLDHQYIGACFDIGHATIEGGLDWMLHARLMEPYYSVVYVKDFTWQKSSRGWEATWCPLGEGMINRSFFKFLAQTAFSGPISQHHEYPLGRDKELVQTMKKDLLTLQRWLQET